MLLAFVLILATLPRVSLVVRPKIAWPGGKVWVECRVARHPDNRAIEWGIAGASSSARELPGENAQVVFTQMFEVACPDPTVAYCVVTDLQRQWTVQQELVCA